MALGVCFDALGAANTTGGRGRHYAQTNSNHPASRDHSVSNMGTVAGDDFARDAGRDHNGGVEMKLECTRGHWFDTETVDHSSIRPKQKCEIWLLNGKRCNRVIRNRNNNSAIPGGRNFKLTEG